MFYEAASFVTFLLCATTLIAQLTFLPLIFRRSSHIRSNIQNHVDKFMLLSDRAHVQLTLMRRESQRFKRSVLPLCEPYVPGPPGPAGDDGEDGEPGDDGPEGRRGLDERDIVAQLSQKCIVCPQGRVGPVGAPGNRGIRGLKGDKGYPGIPGFDGRDGTLYSTFIKTTEYV
ncbi:unnamed protein product [Anisakis simplex]|uniref:Col_cuticle_N domain-containing protein n=1 Tax=Anisakis simplex TaxID=6269 RepID=A0A0M3J6R6_ANISI|nr:unnamed protein product [Anisakis simplex]